MRKEILSGIFFFFILLTGCFEDEGNYDYITINPPKWLIDTYYENITVVCRSGKGEMANFKASDKFIWEKDSAERTTRVRYEWKLNGVVLSEELDFEMPTDKLIQKANIKNLPPSGIMGSFHIIEKNSGIDYMARVIFFLNPEYATADWVVLSEDGGNAKFSVLRRTAYMENGQQKEVYVLKDNQYEKVNHNKIPGKPIMLCMAKARNIGPLGSSTIITDQVAYEVDNATMEKVGELKDQFLDGTPPDFQAIARREIDPSGSEVPACSFVATKKGEIFTRRMSKNFLGGQFLTEPYYLDNKGYKITKFGHNSYAANIPCYDELNRRVVMATISRVDISTGENPWDMIYVYKTKLVALGPINGGVPFWSMPEESEVLYISQNAHISWMPQLSFSYSIYYNDASGNTIVGDFVVNNKYLTGTDFYYAAGRWKYFPRKLTSKSVILKSTCHRRGVEAVYRDFYSDGTEVRFIQRSKDYSDFSITDNPFRTFDSKVTFMTYEWYRTNALMIVIGCENGDVIGIDISNIMNPKEIFKVNVGGKVVGVKELGEANSNQDYF